MTKIRESHLRGNPADQARPAARVHPAVREAARQKLPARHARLPRLPAVPVPRKQKPRDNLVMAARFFCDNCGTEVKRNAARCGNCGRYFAFVRCPQCGFTGEESNFTKGCPSCGYCTAEQNTPDSPSMTALGKPLSGGKLPLWVYVVAAIGLAAVGLMLYFIIMN